MKILQIGQLPKEMGGNYTTGIARVVGELSKQKFDDDEIFLYGTNIPEKKAKKLCNYLHQYMGYRINPFGMVLDMFKNPMRTWKAWHNYKKYTNANVLHMEFFRYNFKKAIDIVRPDLIHFHGSGLIAMHYANLETEIPILLTLHGLMWCGEDIDTPQEIFWKKNAQITLPLANYYTTLNQKALGKMLKLGVEHNKITIIPNGVDSKKFYFSSSKRKEFRDSYQVGQNTIVFITVGLVVDRKGQFSFLKILESLNIDYQYWIIGNGPDFNMIKDYIQNKGLEQKVKLLGYISDIDLYQYHSAADIYAHASTVEGQALSEIEAYSTGLRIIVNKLISDTVIGDAEKDSDKYYIADFDNINPSEIIGWIKKETDERTSVQKFDWSTIAQRYAEVYFNIIK